jgi:predicted transcriptional regulator of viral defense system
VTRYFDARERCRELASRDGVFRSRDAQRAGVNRPWLVWLVYFNHLRRLSRGVYARKDDARPAVEIASVRAPQAVVCLSSALRLHGLLEADPPEVWLAVRHGAHRPVIDSPKVAIVRQSGRAFSESVQRVRLGKVEIPVYSLSKTLADCLKFRKLVGADVADRAIRRAVAENRVTREQLEHAARICRVVSVMAPYLHLF